jgi:single-stranded DNA-specific DHH superfamily exonuclease
MVYKTWITQWKHVLYEYLDLLTISIGADIVPITVDENRVLAHYGLQQIGIEKTTRYRSDAFSS